MQRNGARRVEARLSKWLPIVVFPGLVACGSRSGEPFPTRGFRADFVEAAPSPELTSTGASSPTGTAPTGTAPTAAAGATPTGTAPTAAAGAAPTGSMPFPNGGAIGMPFPTMGGSAPVMQPSMMGGAGPIDVPTAGTAAMPDDTGSCENPIQLGAATGLVWGSTFGSATARVMVGCDNGISPPNVVFRWMAPEDGTYTFQIASPSSVAVALLLAPTCNAETLCGDGAQVSKQFVAGEEATLILGSFGDPGDDPYDVYIDRELETSECPLIEIESTLAASAAGEYPDASWPVRANQCGGDGPTLTFGWTAPNAGEYVISTLGSTFDTVLALRRDSCDQDVFDCVDDTGTTGTSAEIVVALEAGERIVIDLNAWGASGTFAADYVLSIEAMIR